MKAQSPMVPDESIVEILKQSHLFASLTDTECTELAAACRIREYARHAVLIREGDMADGMYILISGIVKVVRLTPDGHELVLHLVREGNMVGEAAVFQKGTCPATGEAVTDVRALFVPAKELLDLILANGELALRLLAALSLRLRMFSHKLAAQGQGSAAQRLSAYLLHRSQLHQNTDEIQMDVSREVLANLLGLARETLSRQFSRFVEQGAIELDGKVVRLRDKARLRSLAQGVEG